MSFFLVAGEPSGDKLGAALMAGLKELSPGVTFQGVGGPLMQEQGMVSLFPMEELSIMGLAEVLPKYFHLKRRIRETAEACLAANPAALITIDSPDFCLWVAGLVKAATPLRTIHYVAPSVWAWRPGRARKMARVIDHVLALLPFEPPLMTSAGMTCDFVGHPVVAEPRASKAELALIPGGDPLVLCLPGSRRGEILRLAPRMGETLTALKARHPGVRAVLPTLPHLKALIEEMTQDWPVPPQITTDPAEKRAAFGLADVALAASGTVSLELAANQCPMVIAYDLHPITLWLMRRMSLTDTYTLVNLVSETRHIPEYIGEDFLPGPVAKALERVLANPGPQEDAMALTMVRLGLGAEPPGLRAARSVLAHL
ncbi:lipid-A-disaccharide synthase [Stagnihabitans tardus]|uniref:Lipid-A-disaccharide synthase n=1 Tax=Stagnihabitans tardus TaxID=2699202 RepID=A0AAE4YAK6_9RHOB|nr:lipid-A-disaccharide synthase [Stagnihabitans tardus]NBZ87896.1 lipid-A-disaccharide synthase [Stagnihabitans tardus]